MPLQLAPVTLYIMSCDQIPFSFDMGVEKTPPYQKKKRFGYVRQAAAIYCNSCEHELIPKLKFLRGE